MKQNNVKNRIFEHSRKSKTFDKKGIIQFGIIAIVIAVIVVGFLAFNPFKAKGITQEEVNKQIQDAIKTSQQTSQQTTKTEPQQTTANPPVENKQALPSSTPAPIELTPSPGSGITQCSQPTGFFRLVYVRQKNLLNNNNFAGADTHKARIAGIFKYTGNCPADIYIEAGIINQPLNTLLAALPFELRGGTLGQPSNCDGNVNYNGVVFANVQPNQEIKFDLRPENYGVEGTYPLNIGAYAGGTRTGCINFGGTTVEELHNGKASFSDKYGAFEISQSNRQ